MRQPAGAALEALPPRGELEARARQGTGALRVPEPLPVDARDPATAAGLAFLRDAASLGLGVDWTLGGPPQGVDTSLLWHLPPPRATPDTSDAAGCWASRFVWGSLYWRRGPGFVTVKDTRGRPGGDAQYTLTEPSHLRVVAACDRPADEAGLQAESAAVEDLVAAGLALRAGGRLVFLPCRLARWPIPYLAV